MVGPGTGSRGTDRLILITVALVQFMISLDLSVVNVGLPRIADGLGFAPVSLTWVIHAYALTFGGLLLLGGTMADRFGRRRVLVGGLILFGAASLAGGCAQAPAHLVLARAVQGTGAAALAPAGLALLTTTFPSGKPRIRAFGIWSAMNAAGGALGVLIGGVLTQYAGWRWVMFVNVPMALVALLFAWRSVPRDGAVARSGPMDVRGALLATGGLVVLVLGVVRTDQYPWTSPTTLSTLALAALLLIGFLQVERTTTADPLVRLGLFRNRSVTGANAYNLLVGAAMASAFYFVSLYLQRVLGHGAALTGTMLLPFAIGVIIGSFLAIRLGYRVPARALLIAGALLTATGFAWFGAVSADGAFLTDVLGPSILASIGFGLCLGPVVSTATAGVAVHETGTASGLLNSSRQIGASLGLAALGTAAHEHTGGAATADALASGYGLGLSLAAALLVAAATIAYAVLPHRTPTPSRRPSMSTHASHRWTLTTMYAGLALSVIAFVAPFVGRATTGSLAGHLRDSYPAYGVERIDGAVTAYLILLSAIGVLAIASWAATIWSVRAQKAWARTGATVLFLAGATVGLSALLVRDTSGDTGLPAVLGGLQLLPAVAGLAAVVLLWRTAARRSL